MSRDERDHRQDAPRGARKPLSLKRTVDPATCGRASATAARSRWSSRRRRRARSPTPGEARREGRTRWRQAERTARRARRCSGRAAFPPTSSTRAGARWRPQQERAEAESARERSAWKRSVPRPSRRPEPAAAATTAQEPARRCGRSPRAGTSIASRLQKAPAKPSRPVPSKRKGRRAIRGARTRSRKRSGRARRDRARGRGRMRAARRRAPSRQEPGQGRRRTARARQAHHQQRLRRGAARALAGLAAPQARAREAAARPACSSRATRSCAK